MEHQLIASMPVAATSVPTRYLSSLATNEGLNPCCRDVFSHTAEFYRTKDDLAEGESDKLVLVCKCGRRHVRIALSWPK